MTAVDFLLLRIISTSSSLTVNDVNSRRTNSNIGENSLAIGRNKIDDIGTGRANLGAAVGSSRGTSESHSAKVDQRNKRLLSILDLSKVFDDPLGVGLAEAALGLTGEGVADRGALGVVFDGCDTTGFGGGGYSDGDAVAG